MLWLSDGISLLILGLTILVSLYIGYTSDSSAQWPMQWGLDGKPTWYAPRILSLSFIPILAIIFIFSMIIIRHYQNRPVLPSFQILISVVFLISNLLFLHFSRR